MPFPRVTRRRVLIGVPLLLLSIALLLVGLFALNGLVLAKNETPYLVETSHAAAASEVHPAAGEEVKFLCYNIAKGFVWKQGITFESEEVVRQRMLNIAETIRREQPDVVFLCESLTECGPCPVNQVDVIAEHAGMPYFAFGENFNFGLPGYRIVSGNAILSRRPLVAIANPSFADRKPFWITRNNRRTLWCQAQFGDRKYFLASVHTDSFDLDSNFAQTEEMLAFPKDEPAIMAGDFNCRPTEKSIGMIRDTGRFAGSFEDPGTFPAHAPDQTIDFILAPANWTLLEYRVIVSEDSDHRPVVARFRVP